MALMSCPDCGREVSQRATTCLGCGYPIQDPRFPRDDPDYAVVVLKVATPETVAKVLAKTGLPVEETTQLLQQAPVLLGRDLTYARAQALCNQLSLTSAQYKAISTRLADQPETWEDLPPALPPRKVEMTFWRNVGTIALGVALGMAGLMLVLRLVQGL